jgi:hypothetical protein
MRSTDTILQGLKLTARDAYDLPSSRRRFADGGQYRIEIPSCDAPGLYPSGQHLESTVVALSRERVRRAAIGLALLTRYSPGAVPSPLPARAR